MGDHALPVCTDSVMAVSWLPVANATVGPADRGGPTEAVVADQRGQSRLDLDRIEKTCCESARLGSLWLECSLLVMELS